MAKKILVIDDEVELLKVVGKRLSGAGYEVITAKTQEVDKETAKTVGADDYISKPFDHQAMLNKIKKFLGE